MIKINFSRKFELRTNEDKIKELNQDIEEFVPESWCGQIDCYIKDRMEGKLNAYQDILERIKNYVNHM